MGLADLLGIQVRLKREGSQLGMNQPFRLYEEPL